MLWLGEKSMQQNRKAYNPGLSEKAWDQLHKKLAALNIKYAAEIQADRKHKDKVAVNL